MYKINAQIVGIVFLSRHFYQCRWLPSVAMVRQRDAKILRCMARIFLILYFHKKFAVAVNRMMVKRGRLKIVPAPHFHE